MALPHHPDPASPPDPRPRRSRRWIRYGVLGGALALALAFALLQSPPPPIPVPPNIATLDPQVREYLARLARSAAEQPLDARRRADLGLAFAVNGLWTEARQSFRHAVHLDPHQPLPTLYAALALTELGDSDAALQELRNVVTRFPDLAPAWYRLGALLLAAGDAANALDAFRQVTRLAPDEWRGWAGLGGAFLRAGSPREALGPLERARALDPFARPVHHLLAQVYQATGQSELAKFAFAAGTGQMLSPMPDDWSSRALEHMKSLADQFENADTLVARGQAPEAVQRLTEALRFHPTNLAVLVNLSRALNAADRPREAWDLLQSARAHHPEDAGLLVATANTAAHLDRPDEALTLARQALALAPRQVEARVAEANALLAAQRDAEAVQALNLALALAPRSADLLVQMGDIQFRNLEQPDLALDAYQRALGIDPLHAGARQRAVALLVRQGRPAEAGLLVDQARASIPDPDLVRELERLSPAPPPEPAP